MTAPLLGRAPGSRSIIHMWIQFDNSDSDGNPVTRRLAVEHGGERHVVEPAATGRAQVPDGLGEFLVASESHNVSAYEPDEEGDNEAADSASADE